MSLPRDGRTVDAAGLRERRLEQPQTGHGLFEHARTGGIAMTRHPPADSRPPHHGKKPPGKRPPSREKSTPYAKESSISRPPWHTRSASACRGPWRAGAFRTRAVTRWGRYGARIFAARLFRLLGPLRPDRQHHPVPIYWDERITTPYAGVFSLLFSIPLLHAV